MLTKTKIILLKIKELNRLNEIIKKRMSLYDLLRETAENISEQTKQDMQNVYEELQKMSIMIDDYFCNIYLVIMAKQNLTKNIHSALVKSRSRS